MNATSTASPRPWRLGLILVLAVLAFSAPQAALLPLLDRDEPRFAEASREMLQSGNFIVPTFNHEPRYAKPPLIYWCQAFFFTLFGENAFAARLPSILATAGTALLLFFWGVELASECIGMIAGLAYPFCLQTIQQGRVATADALLIFFMTLTVYAGWKVITLSGEMRRAEKISTALIVQNYLWGLVLALGFTGGFLAKGPEALLPLIPMLICAWRSGGGVYIDLIANFLLGLCLVLFWALPAYVDTDGDYWRQGLNEGVGTRMVSGLQGHGATTFGWYLLSLPLYLLTFWLSALPWSPLLVTHRKKIFGGWQPDPLDTYLLLNIALIVLVFSLMVTKLPHYTLPAFPLVALLLGRRWIAADLHPRLPTQLAGGFGLVLALLTLILVPIALAYNATPSPVGILVREAGSALTPETEFAVVDFQEPNTVWEMRRVTPKYAQSISNLDAGAFLDQPGPHAVILSSSAWKKIEAGTIDLSSFKIFQARGWNAAKGSFVDLTLVVKS
ncbi:MAG: glycosyltransferase family 39 protein [Methylacidiphilales bacterium]|nr:glycosyltransferase family 39 protein [Candidatus Methylacidiphilales bacterium]